MFTSVLYERADKFYINNNKVTSLMGSQASSHFNLGVEGPLDQQDELKLIGKPEVEQTNMGDVYYQTSTDQLQFTTHVKTPPQDKEVPRQGVMEVDFNIYSPSFNLIDTSLDIEMYVDGAAIETIGSAIITRFVSNPTLTRFRYIWPAIMKLSSVDFRLYVSVHCLPKIQANWIYSWSSCRLTLSTTTIESEEDDWSLVLYESE